MLDSLIFMKAICHKLLSMQDSVAYHFNGLLWILHFQVHKFSRVNSLISESILNATFIYILYIFILVVGSGFSSLKGTVSQDFRHKKNSYWAPYEQAKMVLQNVLFSQRYSRGKMCVGVVDYTDTQRLRRRCVSVVNDYADIV